MLRGFFDNFLKSPPSASWVFLPYLVNHMEAISFVNYFKTRSFVILVLQEYFQYLEDRVKVGLWSIEPNGLDTHTKQFLSQVGSGLFKELNQKDGFDERTNVHRPIMKKRERPPSSIIKTSQATPIRNRNPTVRILI
jgi:hypothetical protein